MKKVILLLMLLLVSSVVAQNANIPGLTVTLMSQDPDPVGPGQYVELRFKLYNDKAETTLQDLELRLNPEYPFSLDPNEVPERFIGDLPALGSSSDVIIVKYKVRVATNAVEGDNPITLEYRTADGPWVGLEFMVSIQTIDANLAITSVETEPSRMVPGEESILNIRVKNLADSTSVFL